MYYSFNFAASVTRVCMEEIRLRGKKRKAVVNKNK
jgi:hypothetical protein